MKALKSPLAAALLRAGRRLDGPFQWGGRRYVAVPVPKAT